MSAQKPLELILARNLLGLGCAGIDPRPGAGDDALRREHLVRGGQGLRRQHADPRCRHGDPQPRIGAATRRAPDPHPADAPAPRPHPGPTLGYRIEDDGAALCYIPDHEPGLGAPLADLDDDWISGFELARGASLLIHDCQYTDEEYPLHLGWGHSPLADALGFAQRTAAQRLLLFHHDPLHSDDFLDSFCGEIGTRWKDLGGRAGQVELAIERRELEIETAATTAARA